MGFVNPFVIAIILILIIMIGVLLTPHSRSSWRVMVISLITSTALLLGLLIWGAMKGDFQVPYAIFIIIGIGGIFGKFNNKLP